MSLLLRTIRKGRWRGDDPPSWLGENDVPADAVTDLQTKGNSLSVYAISDDRSDLGVTLAAYAATRDHLAQIDYALVSRQAVEDLGIRLEGSPGKTPDAEANARHCDLVRLSDRELVALTKTIYRHAHLGRELAKAVGELINHSVAEGRLTADELKEDVRGKLPPPDPAPSSPPRA